MIISGGLNFEKGGKKIKAGEDNPDSYFLS